MQGSLLAMQRSVGNAAVSRLVATLPPAGRTLSRFESGEHAQAGGARKITVNGVEFDEGDVIALGDFYETPEAMQKAPKAELEQLRDLIHRDREHFEGKAGVTNAVARVSFPAIAAYRSGGVCFTVQPLCESPWLMGRRVPATPIPAGFAPERPAVRVWGAAVSSGA
jgi:hypothetical protein